MLNPHVHLSTTKTSVYQGQLPECVMSESTPEWVVKGELPDPM